MRYRKRPCFGRRWWHRRKREQDEELMLPILRAIAIDWQQARDAIGFYKVQKSTWHWRCPCAREEERDG